ncbi:MAG: NAD(P)/FAD-dependent oxidoreductase [Oscillospiraceae bacterium]|nr:NAD(P)/FAD-dependent oxidoreductase [Oscillospiraceae bacterium]
MKYPHIFAPLTIKGVTFKNRVMDAPKTTDRTVFPGGTPTPECINGYEVRARGGVSCVTVTESFVDDDRSARHDHTIDFYTPNKSVYHQEALFVLAESITRHGAVASVELNQTGAVNHPATIKDGKDPFGPSAFVREDGIQVEEMTEQDMEEVASHFAAAALGAKLAGFQMVMLHGGHGWLLGQYISPLTNKRTDKYGGSMENRARFPLMVIDHIRKACGEDFLIEYRMSGAERVPGGLELSEAVEFAKIIQDKVDIIHVTSGMYHNHVESKAFSSIYHPHGCNLDLAAAIKAAVHIPVTAVGGFNSPEQIEEAIASGKCDFVALGRQMLADPDFVNKVARGKEDEIMPCLRCSCFNPLASDPDKRVQVAPFECTVNPTSMRQLRLEWSPKVKEPGQKVLVVGGGPGGMYAALTAAERGHRVTLMDKGQKLGGALWYTDYDCHKDDMRKFRDHLANRGYRAGVDVQLGVTVTRETIENFAPDAVILAIGGRPVAPRIPGLHENAKYALNVYTETPGKKCVMIGGGQVGIEVAMHLGDTGHQVEVLEMLDDYARDALWSHKEAFRIFKPESMSIHCSTQVTEVTPEGVKALAPDGTEVFYEADSVYYALGFRSPADELEPLMTVCPRTAVIGDCKKPARILQATRDGMFAAMDII